MDGNRRWAKERGLETFEGHTAGLNLFYDVVSWVVELSIPHTVFYAFSTENWLRKKVEVDYLMVLFEQFLRRILTEVHDRKVRLRVIGRRSDFSTTIQTLMNELEQASECHTTTTIWIALSYGGRTEIVAACNEAIRIGTPVDQDSFSQLLMTAEMPDPDLIIRTGGEQRLSNFLPWQSVYSELFFTPTYWPAFTKDEFTRILTQYGDRQRRHGV